MCTNRLFSLYPDQVSFSLFGSSQIMLRVYAKAARHLTFELSRRWLRKFITHGVYKILNFRSLKSSIQFHVLAQAW